MKNLSRCVNVLPVDLSILHRGPDHRSLVWVGISGVVS